MTRDNRCSWVKPSNPLYVAYHDQEWGRPLHDDHRLFELLCLETYQAGLSWETAQQMVLDLAGKFEPQASSADANGRAAQPLSQENTALEEAMEALLALGYKATNLKKIKAFFDGTTDTTENYIKGALKMLMK